MLTKYEEALNNLVAEVHAFGKVDEEAFAKVFEAVKENSLEKAEEARLLLKGNHKTNAKIDMNAITMLALYGPEASDLRRVVTLLKIANELSRIGDYIKTHAKNLRQQIAGSEEGHVLLAQDQGTRDAFYESTLRALQLANEAIVTTDSDKLDDLARQINVEESKCDDFVSILEKNMVSHICARSEQAEEIIETLHIMRKLERISDRCVNIVKLARYAIEGGKLKL
jgi:phosphate transport system protein